jgi:hypothetical protein
VTDANRERDLDRLYDLLDALADRVDGPHRLADCDGRMDWPERGVYVFFAPGEYRDGSGRRRVTRVGTHAVSAGSSTSLWDRLKQHSGTGSRSEAHPHGGNHRGSVYRLRVGEALCARHDLAGRYPDWGAARVPPDRDRGTVRDEEYPLERRVSAVLREQPFLPVALDDEPGPDSDRAFLERNVVALVSNFDRPAVDRRDPAWLGHDSPSARIRASGLWNVEGVAATHDPAALDVLADAVGRTTPPRVDRDAG